MIHQKSGEVICSKCGMVVSHKIQETRQESRRFFNTTEQSKERVANPEITTHPIIKVVIIG
jgi:transcription initiation factor TFIIIB Brf1 subunit/transcription initiation factor TFIIB